MRSIFNYWKKVILFIVAYFLVGGIFYLIGSWLCGSDINSKLIYNNTQVQQFVLSISQLSSTLLTIFIFEKFNKKKFFYNLGFKKPSNKYIVLSVLISLLIMYFGFELLWLTQQLTFIKFQFIYREVSLNIALCLSIAFTEEILMRGYVLTKLSGHLKPFEALIISSTLFSLLHIFNDGVNLMSLVNLFFAGILLGLPFIFTKNLWYSISIHFSWNFFQAFFGFKVSGSSFYSSIIQRIDNNNLWNGGKFGFEGSILCAFFQILAIIIIYLHFSVKKSINN